MSADLSARLLPGAALACGSAAPTCPLTLEPLRHPVLLRGARFEADALVAMLAADPRRIHPYERTPLTPDELEAIRSAALGDDQARLRMAELGWGLLVRDGLARDGLGDPERTAPEEAARRMRLTTRNDFVFCLVVLGTIGWVFYCVRIMAIVSGGGKGA